MRLRKQKYQRKNCLICERPIPDDRVNNTFVTCSSRCSRSYTRIYNYVKGKVTRENEKICKKRTEEISL